MDSLGRTRAPGPTGHGSTNNIRGTQMTDRPSAPAAVPDNGIQKLSMALGENTRVWSRFSIVMLLRWQWECGNGLMRAFAGFV